MTPSDFVLALTGVFLACLILLQIWDANYEDDDMKLLIENGTLYLDNRKFSMVEAGNGSADFESGSWPVTVQWSEIHKCEMLRAEGFGWIGTYPECHVVIGNVRGRDHILADVMAQERLRIHVLDALEVGKKVTLEVV